MQGGAKEFSRDYKRKWGPNRDEVSGELLHTVSSVFTTALAGTVYLINEEDEAQQFDTIHRKGTAQFQRLFADGVRLGRARKPWWRCSTTMSTIPAPGS